MSTDIHSYFEVRSGPGSAWQLIQQAREIPNELDPTIIDYDVPWDEQPLPAVRSSGLFALMGVPTRLSFVPGTFQPLVPEDRGLPEPLSSELARIWAGWQENAVCPGFLTLAELDAVPWTNTFQVTGYDYGEQLEPETIEYGEWGGHLVAVADQLRKLGAPDDVRIVFWFDW